MPEIAHQIVEINADNSGSDEIKAYLEDINTASLSTRLLACTRSITSGISIAGSTRTLSSLLRRFTAFS